MLHSPKKRTWPSCNFWICTNIRRQPVGDRNGNRPSMTSTRASASQNVSLSKTYFFGAEGAAVRLPPRRALKNSEDVGSSTITSLFLLKLVL